MTFTLLTDMEEFRILTDRCAGRPHNARSAAEERCYNLLDGLGICYFRVDHDAAMTIPMCHEVERVLEAPICKNLFLCNRQKTQYYLLLLSGDKVFKTKYLSQQLGCARVSFASEEDMQALLGVTPGSATVLALQNDREHRVRLVIDKPVLDAPLLGCHPCRNTSTVAFSTRDLIERILPSLGVEPAVVNLPEEA